MATRSIAIIVPLLCLLAFACSLSDSEDAGTGGGACKLNSQCGNGETCVSGKCVLTDGGGGGGGGIGGGGGQGGDGGGGGTGSGDCKNYTCDGCCTATGICMPGGMDTACGTRSASCVDCTVNSQICKNAACTTQGPSCATCSTGCCAFGNQCVGGLSNSACGNGGAACIDCTVTNQVCNNGVCQ